MKEKLRKIGSHPRVRQIIDVRNVGLYVFGLITLSITWSGMKVIQTNYGLQKQIATLEQETAISKLQNDNLHLRNEYFQTDQFQELAARRQFGLALPGEKMLIVPKEVALKHVTEVKNDNPLSVKPVNDEMDKPEYQRNLEAWISFFLHHDPEIE